MMGAVKRTIKKIPGIVWASLVVLILFCIFADNFVKPQNIENIIKNSSILIIVSIGMTMAILSKKIDISVGGIMTFAGMCVALYIKPLGDAVSAGNIVIALLMGTAIGLLIGCFNGLMIGVFNFNYWLITFATMSVTYGVAQGMTGGNIVAGYGKLYRNALANGSILGIPNMVIIAVVIVVIMWFVLQRTRFGMHIYAVGDSENCARQSGINVKKVRFAIYAVSGALAGLGGVILTARTNSAAPNLGTGYEWNAVAAVIVGGTSMSGGKGSLIGTVYGVVIITAVMSGLQLIGLNNYWQQFFKGVFIMTVIVVDVLSARKREQLAMRRRYK